MRILHVTRDFPPRHCGGISTAVAGLVQASTRAGLAVAVVSFDAWRPHAARRRGATPSPADGRAAGVATASPGDGSAAGTALLAADVAGAPPVLRVHDAADLGAARAFALAWRPDLLHVHDGMLWPLAAELRDTLRAPAVLSAHVVHRRMNALRGVSASASQTAQAAALAAADRILAPSRAAAAALELPAALAARLRVAPHGIEACGTCGAPGTLAAGHGARRRDAGDPMLLAVGRFDDVKGTPELFALLVDVLGRLPQARAVIAGGLPASPRGAARWRAQWERAAPCALRARVELTGWLAPAALCARYTEAAAVVVPSRFETFGLVALEAMWHGAPLAATAAGALPELVTHDACGLLSPPGDGAALAAHVHALLTDAPLAQRLAHTAAATARTHWTWPTRLPAVLAAYAETLNRKGDVGALRTQL